MMSGGQKTEDQPRAALATLMQCFMWCCLVAAEIGCARGDIPLKCGMAPMRPGDTGTRNKSCPSRKQH
jgi:hypothetical protein